MALSRNTRRLIAKQRRNNALCDAFNTAAKLRKKAIIRENLSRPSKRENSNGLVSNYSPTRNPVSYTRPMRWTKGAANVGGTKFSA